MIVDLVLLCCHQSWIIGLWRNLTQDKLSSRHRLQSPCFSVQQVFNLPVVVIVRADVLLLEHVESLLKMIDSDAWFLIVRRLSSKIKEILL